MSSAAAAPAANRAPEIGRVILRSSGEPRLTVMLLLTTVLARAAMTLASIGRSIGMVKAVGFNRECNLPTIGDATAARSAAAREELVQAVRQEVEPAGQ